MSVFPTFANNILQSVLSPPATLAKMAARGMFASVPLNMPPDISRGNLVVHFEGVVTEHSVIECYAPGDETGWAVVLKADADGQHRGQVDLIWGKWLLVRNDPSVKAAEPKVIDGVKTISEVVDISLADLAVLGMEEASKPQPEEVEDISTEDLIRKTAEAIGLSLKDVDIDSLAEAVNGTAEELIERREDNDFDDADLSNLDGLDIIEEGDH